MYVVKDKLLKRVILAMDEVDKSAAVCPFCHIRRYAWQRVHTDDCALVIMKRELVVILGPGAPYPTEEDIKDVRIKLAGQI